MEEISSLFVADSSTNFSRNRVFTFSETIIQPSPKTNETKSAWQMVERSHIYICGRKFRPQIVYFLPRHLKHKIYIPIIHSNFYT